MGRKRLYVLHVEGLTELMQWIAQFVRPSGWEHRLDALETEVYRTRRERCARAVSDDVKEHTA